MDMNVPRGRRWSLALLAGLLLGLAPDAASPAGEGKTAGKAGEGAATTKKGYHLYRCDLGCPQGLVVYTLLGSYETRDEAFQAMEKATGGRGVVVMSGLTDELKPASPPRFLEVWTVCPKRPGGLPELTSVPSGE
jgi:hypothetical protein